ncbi:MAG: BTAD domain-containing putative transcriptional regulator [Chloroflexota bacterium]
MSTLKLFLFGTPRLEKDNQPVKIGRRKGQALLAYLASTRQVYNRDFLATLLWPEADQQTARGNLRRTLSELSKALGREHLYIDREIVQLKPNTDLWIDIIEFQQATAAGINSSHLSTLDDASDGSGSDRMSIEHLSQFTEAASLYTKDFLAGFTLADSPEFDDWQFYIREELRNAFYATLAQLIEQACLANNYELATRYARQALNLDTLHEPAHRQLMTVYAWAGQQAAALRQYDECVRLLDEELGVPPDEETTSLYEAIRTREISARGEHVELNELSYPSEGGQGTPSTDPSSESQSTDASADQAANQATERDATAILNRLEPLPDQKLFGVETARGILAEVIEPTDRPWLIAIDGIGGIGKTTLADALVRSFATTHRFADIGWVSAKQEEFLADLGIQETGRPALDVETLTDTILGQLGEEPQLTATHQEKETALLHLVKERPYLIVVDNLESVADYEALIPYIRQLANPSKFLITTRLTLQAYSDVYCYSLTELNEADTLAFLRHESETRGIARLANASDEQYQEIFRVVGGNPLALKLVMGQVRFLSLTSVLNNLVEAQGKRIDQLYTYIYWQAWQMLDNASRQLFVTMPMIPNGTFDQLVAISELDMDDAMVALEHLVALSLVQIRGDLDEPRYRLHRLTETFLMNEVLKWQEMADNFSELLAAG